MSKKVMIVEDEEAVRRLLAATLGRDRGYAMLEAKDGREALELARREQPDLVFLDIVMPGMDGFAVCAALKHSNDTAGIKMVMLTALAAEAERQKAADAGADDYFVKPFSPRALLDKVSEALAR